MYKHILVRSPTVFTFLLALPTSLLIVLPVLYFGNKNPGWFMTQEEKFVMQACIEFFGLLGVITLAFNQ